MIELQIFSFLLLFAWLWNSEKHWVKSSDAVLLPWSSEKDFYFLMGRLALKYLNAKTSSVLGGGLDKDLIQLKSPRFHLLVLGLSQLSFITPLVFFSLLFQIQPLILFLIFFFFYLLSSQFLPKFKLTEGPLFLAVSLLLVEPLWRLTSMAFAQGDGSIVGLFLTQSDLFTLFLALLFVAFLSLMLRRTLGWSEFFTFSGAVLFLSYQLSAALWIALLLGERLAALVEYHQVMKKLSFSFRNIWTGAQIVCTFVIVLLVLALDPVALPDRDSRRDQMVFLFVGVHGFFFVASMVLGHFLASSHRTKG